MCMAALDVMNLVVIWSLIDAVEEYKDHMFRRPSSARRWVFRLENEEETSKDTLTIINVEYLPWTANA
jgi:hypothetical protein